MQLSPLVNLQALPSPLEQPGWGWVRGTATPVADMRTPGERRVARSAGGSFGVYTCYGAPLCGTRPTHPTTAPSVQATD